MYLIINFSVIYYKYIIIHYKGKNISEFINLCSKILTTCIITFCEDSIINRIINSNYFYFDNFEKNIIINKYSYLLSQF